MRWEGELVSTSPVCSRRKGTIPAVTLRACGTTTTWVLPELQSGQWSSNGDLHLLKSSALQIFPLILPLFKLHRKQTACQQNTKHCWLTSHFDIKSSTWKTWKFCLYQMLPVSQPDWLSDPIDSWGSHSYMEPTQGLAGSRQIRRHDSCSLQGKSLAHIANYNNLLLNSSVSTSNKLTTSAAPGAHSSAALVLSRLDEKAQVSASSDPCCDHWADRPRNLRAHYLTCEVFTGTKQTQI